MQVERLIEIAQHLAHKEADFFLIKGPSVGDKATNNYMKALRQLALKEFGNDFSEQRVCGQTNLAVDFFFPEEKAIVEVAFSLRNPTSEFERDILKAVMAQECGYQVDRLLFISKPGAIKRLKQPGARAITRWAEQIHGLKVEVFELQGEEIL